MGPKGYFLFVFFLLVSKTAAPSLPPPASCTEHGPVWGPHPQPLCWVAGLPARCTPPHQGGHRGREKNITHSSGARQERSRA